MTKSQIYAVIAAVVAVCAAVLERLDVLPALAGWKEWLTLAVVVGGVLTTLFNQSAHPGHVSLPVETAKELARTPAATALPEAVIKKVVRDKGRK